MISKKYYAFIGEDRTLVTSNHKEFDNLMKGINKRGKSFKNKVDAENWIANSLYKDSLKTPENSNLEQVREYLSNKIRNIFCYNIAHLSLDNKLVIYVDGSYKKSKGSYGLVMTYNKKVLLEEYGVLTCLENVTSCAAELFAARRAVELAIQHGYSQVFICYDCEFIRTSIIKVNKNHRFYKDYREDILDFSNRIEINLVKVTNTCEEHKMAHDLTTKAFLI